MSYQDKTKQKEFQRNWINQRRIDYLKDKACADCGETNELTVYGAKSQGKTLSFSYSKAKLAEKLKDSKILCPICYSKISKLAKREKATKHGHSKRSATYITWLAMKDRCLNPNKDNFQYYGGRGVKITETWLNSFENFLADMGERPEGKTLDRINPEKNYEPQNCRWADAKTQGQNKRKNKGISL